jgi:hypothetical protein
LNGKSSIVELITQGGISDDSLLYEVPQEEGNEGCQGRQDEE